MYILCEGLLTKEHPTLLQLVRQIRDSNAVISMQLWRTAMLQIKSDALAAAAELSLSTAPHCRHVITSDSESDCEEYKSCKSVGVELLEDSDIPVESDLDEQAADDVTELSL